jgi:hypothetical protein
VEDHLSGLLLDSVGGVVEQLVEGHTESWDDRGEFYSDPCEAVIDNSNGDESNDLKRIPEVLDD